jgi:hypothetical protein
MVVVILRPLRESFAVRKGELSGLADIEVKKGKDAADCFLQAGFR